MTLTAIVRSLGVVVAFLGLCAVDAKSSVAPMIRSLQNLQVKGVLSNDVRRIVDAGAFIGIWTTDVKKSEAFPNAKYLMLEANENQHDALKAVGEDFEIAVLSDEDDKKVIFNFAGTDDMTHPTHTGNSMFIELTHQYQKSFRPEEKSTSTLDSILKKKSREWVEMGLEASVEGAHPSIPRIDIIKFDLQGAEILAMKGAKETIAATRPVIVMEGSLVPYNEGGPSIFDLHYYMHSINYVLYDIVEDHYATYSRPGDTSGGYAAILLQVDVIWIPEEKQQYFVVTDEGRKKELKFPARRWNCEIENGDATTVSLEPFRV